MNLESLAHFNVQFDETNHMLCLSLEQKIVYEGCLTKAEDAGRLSDYIAHYLGYEPTQDKPRLFHLQEGGLTDTKTPYIALAIKRLWMIFLRALSIMMLVVIV